METYEKVDTTTLKCIQRFETLVTKDNLLDTIKFATEQKEMTQREVGRCKLEIVELDKHISLYQNALTLIAAK